MDLAPNPSKYFIPLCRWVVFHCMDIPQLIHLPVVGHPGCFWFGINVNKVLHTLMDRFLCDYLHLTAEVTRAREVK